MPRRPCASAILRGRPIAGKSARHALPRARRRRRDSLDLDRRSTRGVSAHRRCSNRFGDRVAAVAIAARGCSPQSRCLPGARAATAQAVPVASRSSSSCRFRPAARSTSSAAHRAEADARRGARASSSRTSPAPAATSAPTSSPSRAPDGYTVVMGALSTHAVNPSLYREDAVRRGEGLRADHAGRDHAERARRQPDARRSTR